MAYTLVHFYISYIFHHLRLFRKLENFFLSLSNFRPFQNFSQRDPWSVDVCPCDKYVYSYVMNIFQQLSWRSDHFWRSWTFFISVIQTAYGSWSVEVMVCQDEWWWCQSDFSNRSTLPYPTYIPEVLQPQPSPSLCHTIGSPCYLRQWDSDHKCIMIDTLILFDRWTV